MQKLNSKNAQQTRFAHTFGHWNCEPRRHEKTQTNLSAVPATALFLEREIWKNFKELKMHLKASQYFNINKHQRRSCFQVARKVDISLIYGTSGVSWDLEDFSLFLCSQRLKVIWQHKICQKSGKNITINIIQKGLNA